MTAQAAEHWDQTVDVVGNGAKVALSRPSVRSGSVSFQVSTTNPVTPEAGGSAIPLIRFNEGTSLDEFYADLKEELSPDPAVAARGTMDLVADFALPLTVTLAVIVDVVDVATKCSAGSLIPAPLKSMLPSVKFSVVPITLSVPRRSCRPPSGTGLAVVPVM